MRGEVRLWRRFTPAMRSVASFACASSIVKRLDLVCGGSDLVTVFSDSAPHEIEMGVWIEKEEETVN